jgi:hypothetical protein
VGEGEKRGGREKREVHGGIFPDCWPEFFLDVADAVFVLLISLCSFGMH